jgi:hypothetical protein
MMPRSRISQSPVLAMEATKTPGLDANDLDPGAGLHPLQTPWTLWLYQNGGHATAAVDDWEANLQRIGDFDTVEMFWR